MKAVLKLLDALVVRVVQPMLVLLGISMAVLILAGVVTRSIFGAPLFGVEELVLLSAMWLYMLGAVVASSERSHLQADFLQLLSNSTRFLHAMKVIASAISLLLALAFSVWSFDLFLWSWAKQQTTPVFAVPWFVSQSSPFVCAVLMSLYALRDLLEDFGAAPTNVKNKGAL